jgi:hypothetical protein
MQQRAVRRQFERKSGETRLRVASNSVVRFKGKLKTALRQWRGRNIKTSAFIYRGDRFQHAQIVYYSRSGLLLSGTFGRINQDPVEVELLSGLRICGRIAWSLGAYTGIAFSEKLEDKHPAIIELARRARKSLAAEATVGEGVRRSA